MFPSRNHSSRKKIPSPSKDQFQSPSSSPPERSYMSSNQNIHALNTADNHSNGFSDTSSIVPTTSTIQNGSSSENILKKENSAPSTSSSTGAEIVSADTTVRQIQADKSEAQHVIATYGVDSIELLHMVERWTHQMLGEFYSSRFDFKRILKEKWEKKQWKINSDRNNRTRTLYQHVRILQQAAQTTLSRQSFEKWTKIVTDIDQNTDINQMKQETNNLIKTYLEIVESLEFVAQQQEGGDYSSFATMKTILQRLHELSNKKSYTICIIGLEKCGKSTFINALLGFEFLPTDSERCTQIRTVLKPTLQDDPSQFAVVEFYDDNEFEILIKKMVKKSDEQEQDFESRKTHIKKTRQALVSNDPKEQIFKVDESNRNSDEERSTIMGQLRKYIINELYVNIIKEISIYTNKLPGKNYELLDVPGSDSPIKEHRDAGLQAIKQADAFLFLTDGGRPSLTRDQTSLLDEIQNEKQHYEAMKRAFGIITKLDKCHTKDEYNDHLRKTKQQLIEKGFREAQIFAVCSITNFIHPNSDEYRAIVNKIKGFDDLQNGFQLSKAALNQFIEFELPKTHLNQLIDFGSQRLSRSVNRSVSNAKKHLPSDINFADESWFDEHIKREYSEKWDEIFQKDFFQPIFDDANIWQKTVLTQQREQFLNDTCKFFRDQFMGFTKQFMDSPVHVHGMMMKKYDYTALHSTLQTIDDQFRESLSFQLEECVLKTSTKLAQHLYDEYVCTLQNIFNKISPEEHDQIYQTKLTDEMCQYEMRAVVLRICRPIIIATLRFSHSSQQCRDAAVKQLVLVAPAIACHLCENSNGQDGSTTSQLVNWAPTLKKGIEVALNIYGKTGVQNKITAEIFKNIINRII